MEELRQQLIQLFDDMLGQVKHFKKKTYEDIFKTCFQKYRDTLVGLASLCADAPEEEREAVIGELARVLPDYAKGRLMGLSKGKKERASVDYNMNMAVYVVPVITYTHDEYCEKIAERMVDLWNEMDVTTLTLGRSSYDDIAGGFKMGLCFITTAVMRSRSQSDDCYELNMLRGYRDGYLMLTSDGRELVEEYYEMAPGIVMAVDMQPDAAEVYDGLYESYLRPCIRQIEAGENEKCRKIYVDMVRSLQNRYLS